MYSNENILGIYSEATKYRIAGRTGYQLIMVSNGTVMTDLSKKMYLFPLYDILLSDILIYI